MPVSKRTGSISGLQSCDQIRTLIPGRSSFSEIRYGEGHMKFPRRRKTVLAD